MIILDAQATQEALAWPELVEALQKGFEAGCEMPVRHHHDFQIPGELDGTLLLMPAWIPGKYLGIKTAVVVPENGARGLPAVSANYQLIQATDGQTIALIDGAVLTNRRTAAASALASKYLSRSDASHLLVVGTGGLSKSLVQAHCAVRPIKKISIWGRRLDKAQEMSKSLFEFGLNATAVSDLEEAAKSADVISCATVSKTALVKGEWLRPGTHLDLVGAFKPDMRESDDEVMRRANIFVDTRAGAMKEAGDIVQPIADGIISENDILADLFDLTRQKHAGRKNDSEITVFKSVGTALEDLFAAALAYEKSHSNLTL
ncbi:ornithine cyclodeaminase family protein [Lentilitoribacter sp. EG35]|uniref:ornithine cyclodeaminase family protein n=1 Tax=Lentilitoribacter sp. EG35 TaxID=3234192 RepID=UPI0034612B72